MNPCTRCNGSGTEPVSGEQARICCYWCGETEPELEWAQDRWQCVDIDPCRERCIAQVHP